MNPKPGFTTSEFYVSLAAVASPYVALIFHKTIGSNTVQDFAEVASVIASVAYTGYRTYLKRTHIVKAVNNPDPTI